MVHHRKKLITVNFFLSAKRAPLLPTILELDNLKFFHISNSNTTVKNSRVSIGQLSPTINQATAIHLQAPQQWHITHARSMLQRHFTPPKFSLSCTEKITIVKPFPGKKQSMMMVMLYSRTNFSRLVIIVKKTLLRGFTWRSHFNLR